MEVTLTPATADDLRWVERAVRACPVAMAEFGGFYGEASVKVPPLEGPGREFLIVREHGEPVGFIDADDDLTPGSGSEDMDAEVDSGVPTLGLAWFVAPERRGQHLMATALEVLGERWPRHRLMGAIDTDNGPSLSAARRAGFVDVGTNRWGERVLLRAASESSIR